MPEDDRHLSVRRKHADALYRRFREACGPPMVRLASLEVGDLWYYDGLSVMVTACLGDRSLLVAYDTFGSQEEVAAQFREAYAWLCGRRVTLPANLYLVFAAREESSGNLLVRLFRPGDWAGLPDNVPLPPPEHDRPPGWNAME